MLTKLDILIMESVGYPIRENEVTRPLSLSTDGELEGELNADYDLTLVGNGGIPVYYYTISEGVLPVGLQLDAKLGKIDGVPEEEGSFPITINVRDYDERSIGASIDVSINIGKVATSVISKAHSRLKVYPNPSKGLVRISSENIIGEKMDFVVVDLNGMEITRRRVGSTFSRINEAINLGDLSPGIYFLEAYLSGAIEVHRIMIH